MALRHRAQHWGLYVITDVVLGRGKTHEQIARQAIEGGADVIQLRDKNANGNAFYETALRLRRLTREAGIPFIVNDRVDIALAVDADGVHVGAGDLPAEVVRRLVGSQRLVGVTVHGMEDARRAEQNGADYVGLGPIFDGRGIHPEPGEPTGLELIRRVRDTLSIPIVAIGGISLQNVPAVIQAGANAVAAISAIVTASDITQRVREFVECIQKAKDASQLAATYKIRESK